MESIVIGFSRARSKYAILSRLIRLIDGNVPFSHVFIMWYSDSLKRTMIYEARGNGVNFTNYKSFIEINQVTHVKALPVTKAQKTEVLQFCVDNARTDYGYSQVLGIGLVKLLKLVGISIKNPFTGGNVCSEIALKVLKITNKTPAKDLDLDLITPLDIYKLLSKE